MSIRGKRDIVGGSKAHLTPSSNCLFKVAVSTIPRRQTDSDSSTAIRTLTSMFTQAFTKKGSTLSRGVGLLLVIFILYGTTIEAAHRHGRVLPPGGSAASFVRTGTQDSSFGGQSGCNDCLICQLHQNFTATLISVRPDAAVMDSHQTARGSNPISIHSRNNTTKSGRAPPQAN